jgi:hypothetical protein
LIKIYFIPICLLYILCCLCSDNSLSPEQAALDDLQNRIGRISAEVADIRQLAFIRPVKCAIITRETYTGSIKKSYSSWLTDVEDRALSKEYAQMCLLPETTTPFATTLKMAGNEIWWIDNANALTQPIIAQLQMQQLTKNALVKTAAPGNFPVSLIPETKREVIKHLLRYQIKQQ